MKTIPIPSSAITAPTIRRKTPRVAIAPSAEAMAAKTIPLVEEFNWFAVKLKLTEGNPDSLYVAVTQIRPKAIRIIADEISSRAIKFRNESFTLGY